MDYVAKLFVYGFKWRNYNYNFNKHFTKIDENKDKGYVLEVDTQNRKTLHDSWNDLPFVAVSMKIKKEQNFYVTYAKRKGMSHT